MSLGHGPKIITDGLVFAYDMGPNPGVNKSWKGKPTTNLYADGDYSTKTLHPVRNGPWTFPTGVTDPNGNQAIRIDQDGTTSYHGRDITVTIGETYTSSGWIYASPDSNTTSLRIVGEQGFAPDANYDLTKKGTWQYVTATGTATTTNARILAYQVSNMTTGYCLFGSLQFEQGYGSPFVNGTRSNTQALLDWAGNNAITLNGMQYNSDGTFQTSGATTTDYLSIANGALSTQASSGNWTIDFWLKLNARNSSLDHILQTGAANNFLWFLTGSTLNYQNPNSTTISLPTISTNTWFNLTMTGSGGSVQVYKDGAYVGAMTNTTTFSIASTIGIIMGQEMDSNSGAFASNQSWQGYYGSTKFYNRPLTAAEVAQNFQALRGRYGI